MKSPVDVPQTRRGDVRIDFRRADVGMAQQIPGSPAGQRRSPANAWQNCGATRAA